MKLVIVYEDNHLLVVDKPAGLPTMGAVGEETLHSLAARYLKNRYQKPLGVYVGIVSRLDRMTTGVVVLAKTSKGAARLAAQFASRGPDSVAKTYLAIVAGLLSPDSGTWSDLLLKDDAAHRMRVVKEACDSSQSASLRYRVLNRHEGRSLLEVELLTGRKHQIRVQAAHRGHPVLGDRKYGGSDPWPSGIALHSYRLTLTHPTLRDQRTFIVPPPITWRPLLPTGGLPVP